MNIASQIRDDLRSAVARLEGEYLKSGNLVGGRNFFEERLYGTHFLSRWRDFGTELHMGPSLVADLNILREALNNQNSDLIRRILPHVKVDLAQSTLPES